ncbi:MAG: aminopeptidase, partial [Chloroflexota bacterium]
MSESLVNVATRMLENSLALKEGESLLVITDVPTREIGEALFEGGNRLRAQTIMMLVPPTKGHGAEPPPAVAEAMKTVDVVVCPTQFSLTHTQARVEATRAGARVATMPGITRDMFFAGAVAADYETVAAVTQRLTDLLNRAETARIVKEGKELTMSLKGRQGIASTGLLREKGQSGNLPSGEAYIAPVEGTARGEIIIDGSLVGVGRLAEPVHVVIEDGLLKSA